jgi:apolipoprotein N-acyltransferase
MIPFLLAACAGFLLPLAFPYAEIPLLAWISLVPLLVALEEQGPLKSLLLGWTSGALFFGHILSWGALFGLHVLVALALFQGSWFALFGLAHSLMGGARSRARSLIRMLAVPALWVTMEGARAAGPMGLTWGGLGYSQFPFPALIQISSITGFYGVSFLVAFVNALLAEEVLLILRRTRPDRSFLAASLLAVVSIATALAYGNARLASSSASPGSPVPAGIVQVNTENAIKWDRRCLPLVMRRLEDMTDRAAASGAKYIIWPETSIPEDLLSNPGLTGWIRALAVRNRAHIVFGTPDFRPAERRTYNSAALVSPSGEILQVYDKLRLVPFGEYLPFSAHLRKYRLFDRVQNFSPGRAPVVFTTPDMRFSILVCFESMFPSHARADVARGSRLLMVLTNDAWFGESSAAEHHFIISCFRAVENGVYMVQSANTGISGACDDRGRILCRSRLGERRVLSASVRGGAGERTVYGAVGDLFLYLCGAFAASMYLAKDRAHLKNQGKSGGGRRDDL